jgi:PAS domain S-box-containing protein
LYKILAIDDKKENLIVISAILRRMPTKIELFTAESGMAGIETARSQQPDLIILDIIMPEMNGYEVCRRLKSDPLTNHIPIVILTALRADSASRVKALNMGAEAFLSKPIDEAELIAQVNVMFRIKRAESQLRREKDLLDKVVKEKTSKLKEELYQREKAEKALRENETHLRLKLEYLLSPESGVDDIGLLDLVELEPLQSLQDLFATANNVASVITDVNGNQITKPSNFSNLCTLIRSTELGKSNCQESGKLLGYKAKKSMKPTYHICGNCRLADGSAPIIIGGRHIANWLIGQSKISDKEEWRLNDYARKIGVNEEEIIEAYSRMETTDEAHFKKILDFLWVLAQEISTLAFKNLKLGKDIIERRRAEIALRESEERLRNFYTNATIGIYRSDAKGRLTMANPKLFQMLNISPLESQNELALATDLFLISHERKDLVEILSAQGVVHGYETRIRRNDGNYIDVRESAWSYKDENGTLLSFEGIIEDITEKKKAEQAIIEAKEHAEKSDRLKSEFLAQMSHEIRTPLNTILSFSNLISQEVESKVDDDLKASFQIIDSSSRRLIRTIDLLLNMSEIQIGRYDYTPRQLDLYEKVLVNLYSEFKSSADSKNLKFFISKHTHDTRAICDEYSVTQIFSNLIDNAIKFTTEGYVEIKIYRDSANSLIIEVIDSGIGISEEYVPHLFEAFSQEEQGYTRKFEGNGLGLALVKKYTDLNHAKLEVESTKEKGTIFRISFEYWNQ